MLTKNKILFFIILIVNFLLIGHKVNAEELDISALEITYYNEKKLVIAEGSVVIIDDDGNKIMTEKAEYDKIKDQVTTYQKSDIILKNGYQISSSEVLYDNKNKLITSNARSNLTDPDGNFISVNMFEYLIEKNLFSSRGDIKIVDVSKNKYFFEEMYIDTKNKEIIGSEIKVSMNREIFGLNRKNDPRFVANSAFISKEKSDFSNGIFTTCERRGEKCPPWTLQAKKISHDKAKKTIYYKNAILKIYDIPLFYFPKFFHPDPTVKRQSGFLIPFFTDKTSIGTGFALPYYWVIGNDKDLTFTPKIYTGHKGLFLTEYRQAFENSYLILDTSYTEGYRGTDDVISKTAGSRNHIFGKFDLNLSEDPSYESKLSLNFQKVSNDTYLKVHDINTALVKSENTNLKSDITYNFKRNDMYVDISGSVYEDLNKTPNTRYEYLLPNIEFGNSLFSSKKIGDLNFKSKAYYNNYDSNITDSFFINDFIWNSKDYFSQKGLVNSIEAQIKNTNYESEKNSELKSSGLINEIAGFLAFKSKLPMSKESLNYINTFSPNFMLRYAPGHMRNLSQEAVALNYSNLFSTQKVNKADVIESGTSTILGFDFTIDRKEEINVEKKFNLSLGQAFSFENNKDLPRQTSLDQKMSDIVGEAEYNFSDNSKIEYKFSLDHDINTLNYNEISSNLSFGKVDFNLDYLEERNHVGNENYINTGITLNMNESNSLTFKTKKNFKTESTEFYNLVYQYINDCLAAGIEFNRTFYEDKDIEPSDTIMFKISILPFGGITTPSIYR